MDFSEPFKIGPSYLRKEGESVWCLAKDLLWISEERYSSTYGPANQVKCLVFTFRNLDLILYVYRFFLIRF